MLKKGQFQVLPDYEALSRKAASEVFLRLKNALSPGSQGRFVLGMATGSTPLGLYKELLSLLKGEPGLDLSQLYTVNLDEYYPMPRSDSHSYYSYMREHFWEPLQSLNTTFNYRKQGYIPNGEATDPERECIAYEERIRDLGGIDLQILGIGTNGHIGFNEPGSSGDSRTRVVTLAESTRRDNSAYFGGNIEDVPRQAISMGIGTILEAREIFVLASGRGKAEVMRRLKNASDRLINIPATYLLKHKKVSYYIDSAADSI